MRPKPPTSISVPDLSLPSSFTITPPKLRSGTDGPPLTRLTTPSPIPSDSQGLIHVIPGHGESSGAGHAIGTSSPASRLEVKDIPAQQLSMRDTSAGLNKYLLRAATLRQMQAPDEDGFRNIAGRKFVDVKDEGTVYVEFDELIDAYRATDLYKKLPQGPALYKNEGGPTWSPRSVGTTKNSETEPLFSRHDKPAIALPATTDVASLNEQTGIEVAPAKVFLSGEIHGLADVQGYYRVKQHAPPGSSAPEYAFGFKDAGNYWVKVDPPPGGFNAQPSQLKDWTDYQIWKLYGIHGGDIQRFRNEAEHSGTRPGWVKLIENDKQGQQLINESFRWLFPDATIEERRIILSSYNLSLGQQSRLRAEMREHLQIPQWAEDHKLQSQDAHNPNRFDHLYGEFNAQIRHLSYRTGKSDLYRLEDSLTKQFFDAFLIKTGYRRNKNNCLYRTDIAALFRGDERTPFELANDGWMLPRYGHTPGATTQKPMSATVSLSEARNYGSKPDHEYLLYNRQTNKYPGRDPDDADISDALDGSDGEWSDSDSTLPFDLKQNYETIRHNQRISFTYGIDTRNLEVVPGEENKAFNSRALSGKTWFPDDPLEALISVSSRGISADRIWLFNSSATRAVRVKDIRDQAGHSSSERIEERTHSGANNHDEYDGLIERAVAAGKPVLELTGDKDWFATDIVWPQTIVKQGPL
ncbi:hypothetical protein [Pseudomonas sp.]|uniref:hypothetical protein n=1 Tax=Pseudomonas sp. TaxID=306 RepID=UPI003F375F87